MAFNYLTTTNKNILHSFGMLLVALTIYFFVLFLPPPISTVRPFLDFDFGTAIILVCIFALLLRKKGFGWETASLTMILLLLAISLIYKWQTSMYDGEMFAGLLPWSDARDYYESANFLLNGNPLTPFGTRRPLFSGFLSALLAGSSNNLQITLASIGALSGISIFLASREIQRVHNSFSASVFILICYWFYHPFTGTTMSENLALCLGCLSLAFLAKGARRELLNREIAIGLFTLTIALNARAGAFFILPAILLWIGIPAPRETINWRRILISVFAVSMAMTTNLALAKLIGSKSGAVFSNYSYTLYGLASGYKGWNQAAYDHPGATEKEIYKLTIEKIKSEPSLFATGVIKSYEDYFTPSNGAFSFMRLVHDRKNRADRLFWGLTAITLMFSIFWKKRKPYSFALFSFLGIVASAGLLPPNDSDSMRTYAATIPFTAYIISTVFAIPQELINLPTASRMESKRHIISNQLLPFTGILLALCLVAPFIVKRLGSLPTNISPISCPQTQKAITFNIGGNSSVKLRRDDSLHESYMPDFRITDFQNGVIQGPLYRFYPFLDDELISLKAGDVINIGTFQDIQQSNSNSLRVGYLITKGESPQAGTYHICVIPSTKDQLKNMWFYYSEGRLLKQKPSQTSLQNNSFVIGTARIIYGLAIFCIIFLLAVPPGIIHSYSWKQQLLITGSIVLILLATATYLHRTAIFPFAWQRKTLDSTKVELVEGYFYQLPLGVKWMDQKSMRKSPVIIYEDGIPLAHPNSKFYAIKKVGKGHFTIQSGYLFFSTSDNSDPRYNGKLYEIYWPAPIYPFVEISCYVLALISVIYLAKYGRKSTQTQGSDNSKPMQQKSLFDSANYQYQQTHIAHWDSVARKRDHWRGLGKWYHRRLIEIYQFLVTPNQRVLEIGCGMGSLIAQLQPAHGVGIDFSSEMIARAKQRHPEIEYHQLDAHDLSSIEGTFDVIILSDTVNDLWDVQRALEQTRRLCTPHTRLMLNFYSHVWQLPLTFAQNLNLAAPLLSQNWLTPEDIENMLRLAGFESIRTLQEILWPLPLGGLANRYFVKLWPFREFALSNFVIARPVLQAVQGQSVSVVVAARNEAGNIRSIFKRVPKMGSRTELIFVEGHSRDNTYETIEKEIPLHRGTPSLLFRQPGIGKADAIRLGFEKASGDILMILDADLTVPPEDLPRFYEAIVSGKGEFINGVRLVYPMEKEAMRTLNFIGNKLFSMAFSWMLGQPIKDTLCGTKVLWREDYQKIAANRSYFGDFDPFGDFDLIFGAAKLNRKIIDLPIRYRERTYGTTNISRWKHGLLLLRMVAFAARRIKFV